MTGGETVRSPRPDAGILPGDEEMTQDGYVRGACRFARNEKSKKRMSSMQNPWPSLGVAMDKG